MDLSTRYDRMGKKISLLQGNELGKLIDKIDPHLWSYENNEWTIDIGSMNNDDLNQIDNLISRMQSLQHNNSSTLSSSVASSVVQTPLSSASATPSASSISYRSGNISGSPSVASTSSPTASFPLPTNININQTNVSIRNRTSSSSSSSSSSSHPSQSPHYDGINISRDKEEGDEAMNPQRDMNNIDNETQTKETNKRERETDGLSVLAGIISSSLDNSNNNNNNNNNISHIANDESNNNNNGIDIEQEGRDRTSSTSTPSSSASTSPTNTNTNSSQSKLYSKRQKLNHPTINLKKYKDGGEVDIGDGEMINILPETSKKRYQCKVCKSVFSDRSQIKFHMRIHSDEKPYQCNFVSCYFFVI